MANLKLYSVDLSIMDKTFVLSQTRFTYHPETRSFTHVGRWYGIDGLTIDDWKKILKQLCDYLRKRQEHANKGTQFIAMYVISQYHKGTLGAPLQRVPLHCHMLLASKRAASPQLISNRNNPSILAYYGLYRGFCLFAYW